eukprot:CAMPEP_0194268990 /NCGR_PEP_ID=MMETSP0169-20130528/3238_1 /TAXON_ID=218684 /ORGANISM="Corethron pennatum, Strain L29A3" /LENGTH=43 /DNA_ID= /DNA_START= /DNA_END= /DNA_ORIENTATION=
MADILHALQRGVREKLRGKGSVFFTVAKGTAKCRVARNAVKKG